MACQRYRKFVFSQKNVIVKKKWSFGPTEEQAVLLRVAEMQSFAGAGNKFTCKGKALQRIIQIIPSLRMGSSLRILWRSSALRDLQKAPFRRSPMCRQGSNNCHKAVMLLEDLGSRILVLFVAQYLSFGGEAAFWSTYLAFRKFLKILKFSHRVEERHLNLIKWTLLKTSCCICPWSAPGIISSAFHIMFREVAEDTLLSFEANLIQQRSSHWTSKDSNVNPHLKKAEDK